MNTSCSTYIVERAPLKYGGHQKDYQQKFQSLVSWGAKQIRETPREEAALVELFKGMFTHFSEKRQEIAFAHRTPAADKFGIRRDTCGTREFYHTILTDEYKEYNAKILAVFEPHLRSMSLEKNETSQRSKKIEETLGDISSTLEIEIFEHQDLTKLKWLDYVTEDECPAEYIAISPLRERARAGENLNRDELRAMKQGVKVLKEKKPALYKRSKMGAMFLELNSEFPPPKKIQQPNGTIIIDPSPANLRLEGNLKSFFMLATARISVKGKNYATTQFFTWLYRDLKTDPVDRMLKHSKVILIHQDNFLIDDTLQETAKIFAKAVLAPDKDKFKIQANLFRYYFAQAMPCERGSSAMGEMFEGSLYGARDLSITYNPKKQIDLEALISPLLSQFMKDSKEFLKEEESKRE